MHFVSSLVSTATTMASKVTGLFSTSSEIKTGPAEAAGSCPFSSNSTLKPTDICPVSNQTLLQEYQDECINSVSSPSLVDACMEDCADCCVPNSTSVVETIKAQLKTYIQCGAEPSEESGDDQSGLTTAVYILMGTGTAFLISALGLAYKLSTQANGQNSLDPGTARAFRLTSLAGTVCLGLATGLAVAASAPAAMVITGGVLFGVSLTGTFFGECAIRKIGVAAPQGGADYIQLQVGGRQVLGCC